MVTTLTATLATILLSAACGGAPHGEPYQKAVSAQEACCHQLSDDQARAECMEKIVRVSQPDAIDADANRATYRCVERNFTCDPATGTATPKSAQAALECIQDLGS